MFSRDPQTYSQKFSAEALASILADDASPINRILSNVPDGSKVLDIGAGNGVLAWVLKKKREGIIIDGIEPSSFAADLARPFYRNFYQSTFQESFHKIQDENYSHIVLADVLEHLVDPVSFLESFHQFRNQNMKILISIPNVSFGEIRFSLFKGIFKYVDSGILEKTHLRFFYFDSIKELVHRAHFSIEKMIHLRRSFFPLINQGKIRSIFDLFLLQQLAKDPLASTFQFLLVLTFTCGNQLTEFHGTKTSIPKTAILNFLFGERIVNLFKRAMWKI